MKVLAADLLRSAARAADLPRDPLPQIAFVGRSNVGKSSLINALVKRPVARTSAAPGKTRLINLYVIALAPGAPIERFYLVDLPGYGYARGGAPSQQAFEALTQEYFACPPAESGARGEPLGPTAVLQLVDIRHPGLPQDLAAGTGWPRSTAHARSSRPRVTSFTRGTEPRCQTWKNSLKTPVLPVSAASGEGMEDLWTLIVRLLTAPR